MHIEPHTPKNDPQNPPSAWLLTPATLADIRADDALITRLAGGELPAADDLDPVAGLLGLWLREVANGGTR